MTTSVRECRLRNNPLLKLHHQIDVHAGEQDSVPEPARKKVRFAERVEEQTPEGTVTAIPQSTNSSSPTTTATSMQVDESDQDRSKRQKFVHGTDMELDGLVVEGEFDRLQRDADRSFLVQSKTQIQRENQC